jgi:type IV secretory pathway VirB4 component
VFAKSGSGKSYAVKLEILRSLMFDTDVIVIDPEQEYEYLAEATGGRTFNISASFVVVLQLCYTYATS